MSAFAGDGYAFPIEELREQVKGWAIAVVGLIVLVALWVFGFVAADWLAELGL